MSSFTKKTPKTKQEAEKETCIHTLHTKKETEKETEGMFVLYRGSDGRS